MIKRFVFLSVVALTVACQPGKHSDVATGLISDSAMVVSAHPIASRIGVDVMRKGGNAIDAVIATQFALALVFPEAGNIGGGGFLVYREADGHAYALDYRERAPSSSKADMYLDEHGEVIPELSTMGHLASGVPGSVDGMVEAHSKFGTLPWNELVQPSIDLARKGVPLTRRAAQNLNAIQDNLRKFNTVLPEFLLRTWSEGDTLRWIEMAETLELIRDHGRAGFYEGKTADDIIAEMKRANGIITHEDLKNYRSRWLEPLKADYKNYSVITMPPPSSGGIAVLQMLKCIEPYPISEWGHNSAATTHLFSEVMRRAFADRSLHLGDPDYYSVPVQELLSTHYIRERMETFNPKKASRSNEVGPGIPSSQAEPSETTHISVVDRFGNAASVTTTLNDWFGSMVVVPGSGFFLNNEMDDFSIKPGHPNSYGLIGGEANKIEPGKTMLSSMTPTIVEKEGKLFLVAGSPGGARIINAVFQVILNTIEFDMGMQQAVNAGRIHNQWLPDATFPESGAITRKDSLQLVKMGHTLLPLHELSRGLRMIGRTDCILVLPDGKLEGGADYQRGDDAADGY
jgi:gamma-glutamyltranspeptidase/glutathione hydrolase